jgi:hypothetical protein
MANVAVPLITFYRDADGEEQIHKIKEFKAPGNTLSSMLTTLTSALGSVFQAHPRDGLALKALWWGNSTWEDHTDYQINQSFEGCALIFVDESLINKGANYFNIITEAILAGIKFKPVSVTARPCHVFMSYAADDAGVASELKESLEQNGMRCFMAEKDIGVAVQWQPAIRNALLTSQYVLLLLTPRSIKRPWVLLEIGAAWALEKKLIPALVHVDVGQLVEPIRNFQARVIETSEQRKQLVSELSAS